MWWPTDLNFLSTWRLLFIIITKLKIQCFVGKRDVQWVYQQVMGIKEWNEITRWQKEVGKYKDGIRGEIICNVKTLVTAGPSNKNTFRLDIDNKTMNKSLRVSTSYTNFVLLEKYVREIALSSICMFVNE